LLTTYPRSSPPRIGLECLSRPDSSPRSVEVDGPALLTAHLAQVQEAIKVVCRLQTLTGDAAEELTSLVYLKLLQGDGAVLRRFRGESSLRTFLIVVVKRILLDSWIARNGKWRPSADARRLGTVAVELERLVHREGLTVTEAGEMIRASQGVTDTDDEFAFLLSLLPTRSRRRFVSDSHLTALASVDPSPLELLLNQSAPSPVNLLKTAMATLNADDRQLLSMRFAHNLTVREIASQRGVDPKVLYRRFERLLRRLRMTIAAQS
jgi:RNA polymerase sigma factor for flagellar operon FliA